MTVPNVPTTLTPQQVADLNEKLSHLRHDVNNQLALMTAALELVRFRPELQQKMLDTLAEQPPRITAAISQFSAEFEQALGIVRQ